VRARLVFGLPKNDRDRRIPLCGTGAAELAAHLDDWPAIRITLPWEDPESSERVTADLVFTSTRRMAITRSAFDSHAWKPAVDAAGLSAGRDSGMHALRHFYASVLLDAGENIKALSAYLGHADPGFTLRTYTRLMPSSEDRTRAAIDRVWGRDAE
jgi:integrase